ncbi:hypothetical protein niasHT_022919 [Heterodera trifolii]|uniref:G-protein coupled receptors family 1 profile domain-containing protein n=1 Tax=Heterodera trifolii TaxID=157864 RepID=A0ABD2JYU6_9BILA
MSLNATQPSQQQPLTYVELIQQNGGQHTLAMWLILGEKCALSSIGILFNATLVAATLKSKSKNGNSKRFHAILLSLSVVSNCYLMWLQYEMADGNNSMVFCTASSVSALGGLFYTISFNRAVILHILLVVIYIAIYLILKFKKENQHFSKSIFRSLLFLVFLETIGWFPIVYLPQFLKSAQFSPITTTYISTGFTTISSCITGSANAPTLYYFNQLYRTEINALLVSIGIKKSAGTAQQQQQQNTNPRIPLNVVTRFNNWTG